MLLYAESNTNPSRARLGERVMAMGRSSFRDCGFRDLESRGEDIKVFKQGDGALGDEEGHYGI